MRRLARLFPAAIAIAASLAAASVFLGPDFLLGRSLPFAHDILRSDFVHFSYPIQNYYAEQLRQGVLPLWCPSLGAGIPLLAQGQTGVLSPVHIVLFALLPTPLACNATLLLHLVLAMVSSFAWAREIGAGRAGAAVAGAAFAFSGFMVCHLHHQGLFEAAAWTPFLLLMVERWIRTGKRRELIGLAAGTGMCLLAGHPQTALYDMLVVGAYSIVVLIRAGRHTASRDRIPVLAGRAAGIVAAVAIGALLAAPQLLPIIELAGQGPRRTALSFEEASTLDAHAADLALFLDPYARGDPGSLTPERAGGATTLKGYVSAPGRQTFHWEVCGYVGLLTLALAGLAPCLGLRRPRVVLLWLIAAGAVLVALGPHGLLARLLHEAVPGFDRFRVHGRFLLYADLCLAGLAGLGLTRALDLLKSARLRAVMGGIAAVAVFADLYVALGDYNAWIPAEWAGETPATAAAIRARGGAAGRVLAVDPDHAVFQNAYGRARGWKGDLTPYRAALAMMEPNLNLLHGFDSATVYTPAPTDRSLAVDRLLGPRGQRPRVASLLGVRWLISADTRLARDYDVAAVLPGDAVLGPDLEPGRPYSILVFENPSALPRALLVPRARFFRTDGGGDARLAVEEEIARGFDPRTEVLVEAPEGSQPQATGEGGPIDDAVEVVESSANSVRLAFTCPRDAWLFLGDSYYPGWSAFIDGEPAPILPANLFGRAVQVPAGRHEVSFEYMPGGLKWGAVLTVAGLAGMILMGCLARSTKK